MSRIASQKNQWALVDNGGWVYKPQKPNTNSLKDIQFLYNVGVTGIALRYLLCILSEPRAIYKKLWELMPLKTYPSFTY